jgi:hypothetical protein
MKENAAFIAADKKRNSDGWDALHKEAQEQQKLLRSKQLNYNV